MAAQSRASVKVLVRTPAEFPPQQSCVGRSTTVVRSTHKPTVVRSTRADRRTRTARQKLELRSRRGRDHRAADPTVGSGRDVAEPWSD